MNRLNKKNSQSAVFLFLFFVTINNRGFQNRNRETYPDKGRDIKQIGSTVQQHVVALLFASSSVMYFTLLTFHSFSLLVIMVEEVFFNTRWMMEAISFISSGPMFSVVTAGVPTRMPLVYQGPLASKGSTFLFRVMPQAVKRFLPGGRLS